MGKGFMGGFNPMQVQLKVGHWKVFTLCWKVFVLCVLGASKQCRAPPSYPFPLLPSPRFTSSRVFAFIWFILVLGSAAMEG